MASFCHDREKWYLKVQISPAQTGQVDPYIIPTGSFLLITLRHS